MDQTHRPARHGQRQPCTPAGHAQHSHGHGQPAQPPASAGTAQQHGQRPARALRIVTGLALLALAVFVTLSGRRCLC